jgi:flavorubredoxin/rubredoxin
MISRDIQYIGVNDHELDLFEGQYIVPGGMAYNSYVILDEKTAVLDSVDARFGEQWLNNLAAALGDRKPDYLIVQHMEPDHSANIIRFTEAYPDATVVASAKAFQMMKSFYGTDLNDRRLVVGEKDTLTLGRHTLTFITAPMVHWPEVIFTWDAADGVLFSADAFGKFGALDYDDPEGWACEARRYYFGIVGKYGTQVQAVLKKLAGLEIKTICPLHGPVLDENLPYYLGLYQTWSSYGTESEGIVINYNSVYGHTKEAAEKLAEMLRAKGCPKVAVNDLARCDMPEAVEDTFRYGKAVLATTTYNADIFPFMRTFIEHLKERNWQNKTVGLIENGTWAPMAAKTMKEKLEGCKNLTFANTVVRINSALNDDSRQQIEDLAAELCQGPAEPEPEVKSSKGFVCTICGYVYEGDVLPEDFTCPLCRQGADVFEPVE